VRIKVDEDLPVAIAGRLKAAGYLDTRTIVEQGMGGWKDAELWPAIQADGRFLVTADKGFADIRAHRPGSHAGVLLLRPDLDGIGPVVELLEKVIEAVDLDSLEGCITVATPQGLRVRRP
jgi:predicted nuclease of predicted toxin-antitoxin system